MCKMCDVRCSYVYNAARIPKQQSPTVSDLNHQLFPSADTLHLSNALTISENRTSGGINIFQGKSIS